MMVVGEDAGDGKKERGARGCMVLYAARHVAHFQYV